MTDGWKTARVGGGPLDKTKLHVPWIGSPGVQKPGRL